MLISTQTAFPAPKKSCMGCTDCGGKCGGGVSGLGSSDGLFGTGLFASGFDLSGWNWAEWLTVVLGAYAVYSMVSTTKRGARAVSSKARYIAGAGKRRRRARAAQLRREANELEAE